MSGLDQNDPTHAEWDELAVGWALRALEPDDEGLFTTHLLGCQRCQSSLQDSGRVLSALVDQLPQQSPRPELRSRLMAEVATTPRSEEARRQPDPAQPDGELIDFAAARSRSHSARGATARRARSTWTSLSTLVAAAAAVLVIAGLGIWNLNLQTARDEVATVAAERAEILQDLAAAGPVTMTPLHDGDGQPVATLVNSSSQKMIMTNGLPVNDDNDQIYVLWGLDEVGDPQPLGTFDVVQSDLDLRTLSSTASGIDTFNGYGVTLESGRTAPSTPTLPMAASG